ncbi:flagellar filament capping protein FliD [Planktomarina temperata]|nr:flagellar filament capping protein FliD [Planktomarina temperata]
MSQTISNDYVSMINKRGSGYNIPEIVDAIVDAEIVPVKEIVTAQKEQVNASISGMGTLKSSMLATQALVNSISSDSHLTLKNSPNSDYMQSSVVDGSAVVPGVHEIRDISIAHPMIWRMDDGDPTRDVPDQTITIEFGESTSNGDSFSASSAASATVAFSNDTLASSVAKLNTISGLKAELVQIDSNSNNYSVILTSETGSTNGFQMTSSAAGYWQTGSAGNGTVTQNSTDATVKINDQTYTRASNTITDVIPGLKINLLTDRSDLQTITIEKSSSNIQKTVETLIGDLNAYKSDLGLLGFIDETGDENGELANSSYLKNAKRHLAQFMMAPITGFGDSNIYFVDFGIKTAKDGSYTFDQKAFDRTYVNTPEKFDALTQDKAYSSDLLSTPTSISDAGLPPGKYEYRQSSEELFSFNTSQLLATSVSGSASDYTRTVDGYTGFSINTYHSNPSNYNIFIGHSVKTKINNFFANALSDSAQFDATVDLYKDRVSSLDDRLTKIDKREAILQAQYTKQFSEMEKVVNSSTSSAEFITQLVDGWNQS